MIAYFTSYNKDVGLIFLKRFIVGNETLLFLFFSMYKNMKIKNMLFL